MATVPIEMDRISEELRIEREVSRRPKLAVPALCAFRLAAIVSLRE